MIELARQIDAEARRLRKRGEFEDPEWRVLPPGSGDR